MSNEVYVKNSNSAKGGVGFTGLLTIVFIVLKLCKFIDWSWVWVLSPLWISIVLGIIFFVLYIGVIVWIRRI